MFKHHDKIRATTRRIYLPLELFFSNSYRTTPYANSKRSKSNANVHPWSSDIKTPSSLLQSSSAPEKDGRPRFCVDYRNLNTITAINSYSFSRIKVLIYSFIESRIFSTLDRFKGYWQINIAKRGNHKTPFGYYSGTFQNKRMSFGLENGPTTFQRALYHFFTRLKWKMSLVYIDGIIFFSKNVNRHILHD